MFGNCLWVCVEGIDGAGKTSQAIALQKNFIDKGYRCHISHVFDTDIGKLLKKFFLEKSNLTTKEEILLLLLTRLRYYNHIKKIAQNYDIIISDRMFLSIEAMQGTEEQAFYKKMKKEIFGEISPDVTFVIDVSAGVALGRKNRTRFDRIEKKGTSFHETVRKNFLNLVKDCSDKVVIDGNVDPSIVTTEIQLIIEKKLEVIYGFQINYTPFSCAYGEYGLYVFKFEQREIPVLYKYGEDIPLVRIQSQCILGFVFESNACDCGIQLKKALKKIKERKHSIFIYLPYQEARGHGLFKKVSIMRETIRLGSLEESRIQEKAEKDMRTYSEVKKILEFFFLTTLDLLTNSLEKIRFLEENDFEIKQIVDF